MFEIFEYKLNLSISKLFKYKLMLELQKFVLQRVHEDAKLFKKELKKSLKWLSTEEMEYLRPWVWIEFGDKHSEIIKEVLNDFNRN